MKVKIPFLALAVVLLFSLGSSHAPETHTLTLNVDTGVINNENTNEVSNFGQEEDISNPDFTTNAQNGDIIIWRGVSTISPDDKVMITSINHEGGARVFGKNVLTDSAQNPGVVIGIVTEGKKGDVEKYTISFKVFNNGQQRNGTFHIDPKIQILY